MPWGPQSGRENPCEEGQEGGCKLTLACDSREPTPALETSRLAWPVNPKQALSQVVNAWHSLAFPLKGGKEGGPFGPRTKTPPTSPSQETLPQQLGSSPTWLPFLVPPPQNLAGSPIQEAARHE
jgi:hypothetical protein